MDDAQISTISKRSVHGVFALASRQFLVQCISLVTSLVIFTILSPSEIGIYTAVIAIQRIISFFSDFGFGAALVQKKDKLEESELSTSFTIQTVVTFGIFIVIFLLINPLSSFFGFGEDGKRLLLALVFTIFLSSFKTIPSIMLERSIQFQKIIIPQVLESITFNVLLVVLVSKGYAIASFTYSFLASSLISIPVYYFISPWKIRFGIDKASLIHLKFGLQFQAKNVLAAVKDDFLIVFLAKVLTFTELGYIGFAQRLSFFFYRYIVDSVTKVTFSTYARIQESDELLGKAVEKSLFFVSMTVFPLLFGLIILSPSLVRYFPGWQNKWEPAVLSLIFFSANAAVSSLSGILVNVLDATGRVSITLKLMVLWTTLTWILTPLLIVFYGYNGVAFASFLVTITIILTIHLVKKVVEFRFIKSIIKPLFASFLMCAVVYFAGMVLVRDFITLMLAVVFGGMIYIISMYTLVGSEIRSDFKKLYH